MQLTKIKFKQTHSQSKSTGNHRTTYIIHQLKIAALRLDLTKVTIFQTRPHYNFNFFRARFERPPMLAYFRDTTQNSANSASFLTVPRIKLKPSTGTRHPQAPPTHPPTQKKERNKNPLTSRSQLTHRHALIVFQPEARDIRDALKKFHVIQHGPTPSPHHPLSFHPSL